MTKSAIGLLVLTSLVSSVASRSLCQTVFGYEYFIQNIPENTPLGSNIGHVDISGTDEEISLNQVDNEYFLFNTTTRNITLQRVLNTDRNASEIPVLSVSCTILASSDSRPISITIRVIVQDWNNNSPIFNEQHHVTSIPEDAEIGTTVYTDAVATDNDKEYTGNSRITYRIVTDDDFSLYFRIPNPTKASIVLQQELDYESDVQMVILIEARDNPLNEAVSGPSRSSTATLTVNILDADDQNPRFSDKIYRGSISEDSEPGTVVTVTPRLYAEDPDTMNVSMHYRLLDAYDIFEIDNATATIYTKRIIFGDLQTVTVVVLASQVINEFREMFALLTITINAANVNAPKFSKPIYEVEKLELEPVGSVLVTTTATDIDFGTQIQYALLEQIDDITVDESGSLILQRALDYELQQQLILHVTASDESHTATATVIITVLDVNDNNPVLDPVDSDFMVAREQGRLVTIVTATDSDFNDNIKYSVQNYQNLFTINDDGELYITASEEELVLDEYNLLVLASDSGFPPRSDSTIVTVKFPPLGHTLPPPTRVTERVPISEQGTDNMITIVLGALAGLLLIVIIVLVIVLIIRHRRMKEALNRAREPKGYAAKGLTYRQAESPDDLPKMDLHYAESTDGASEYDGATTIQDNPLNDPGVNEGYLQSSVSDEMDREMNEIEIETAVVPYDDDFGYPSGRSKYSNHLRTFQGDDSTSSGSAQSDSTGGSRRVLVNGNNNNKGGAKLTSWDSDDKIHPQGSEKLLEQGLPNKQTGEKPEITVYF